MLYFLFSAVITLSYRDNIAFQGLTNKQIHRFATTARVNLGKLRARMFQHHDVEMMDIRYGKFAGRVLNGCERFLKTFHGLELFLSLFRTICFSLSRILTEEINWALFLHFLNKCGLHRQDLLQLLGSGVHALY